MADKRTPAEKALNVSLTDPETDVAKAPGADRPPSVEPGHRTEHAGAAGERFESREQAERYRSAVARPGPTPASTGREIPGRAAAGPAANGENPPSAPSLDYDLFIGALRELDFITRDVKADHAVKAVLGVLASKLPEDEARLLTSRLPGPLSFERLRGHQAKPTPTSGENYFTVIAKQLNLPEEDATRVIQRVLHIAMQTLEDDQRARVAKALPEDWRALLDAA